MKRASPPEELGGGVATRPQIIRSVESTVKPPKATAPKTGGEVSSGTTSEGYVDIPQSDGTVLKQKVKFDVAQETKQDTAQKTENKAVSEQKTEQSSVSTQKQKVASESVYANTDAYAVRGVTTSTEAELFVGSLSKASTGDKVKIRFPSVQQKQILGQKQGQAQAQGQKQGQRQAQDVAQAQKQLLAQATIQKQAQAQRQAQDVAQSFRPIQTFAPITPPTTRTPLRPTPETPITPPPRPPKGKGKNKGLFGRFSVQVKSKGKFRTVGQGLKFEKAVQRGAGIVGATTSASFRVIGNDDQKTFFSEAKKELPFNQFRPSKKDSTVFVEKRQFRISSSGEKTGLFRAKRQKGFFGSGKNGIF